MPGMIKFIARLFLAYVLVTFLWATMLACLEVPVREAFIHSSYLSPLFIVVACCSPKLR
jgi:hypothetical protein